jgi:hypothetical protein
MMGKSGKVNQLRLGESSPEKAGVGGSIPSLATFNKRAVFCKAVPTPVTARRAQRGSVRFDGRAGATESRTLQSATRIHQNCVPPLHLRHTPN